MTGGGRDSSGACVYSHSLGELAPPWASCHPGRSKAAASVRWDICQRYIPKHL